MAAKPDRLKLDAGIVLAQIANLRSGYPELEDDAELLASAIEGETDFERIMERIIGRFLDRCTMKEAIAARMASLKERGEREDRGAEALKALAYKLMLAAEQTIVRLPEATLSVRTGSKRVVIDDPEKLPQGYFRVERVPLKTEIAAALERSENFDGAHFERAEPCLSVRTK